MAVNTGLGLRSAVYYKLNHTTSKGQKETLQCELLTAHSTPVRSSPATCIYSSFQAIVKSYFLTPCLIGSYL